MLSLASFSPSNDKFFKYASITISEPFEIFASEKWSDDAWYRNQKDRALIDNAGWLSINNREADGTIIGGNLCTLNLLQGTEYFPSLENSILFIEDDEESQPHHFDRDLQSLIHMPSFVGVKGLIIGRFQKASNMDVSKLRKIIDTKRELKNIPVIANVDFGHTDPKITIPVGGFAELRVGAKSAIRITKH